MQTGSDDFGGTPIPTDISLSSGDPRTNPQPRGRSTPQLRGRLSGARLPDRLPAYRGTGMTRVAEGLSELLSRTETVNSHSPATGTGTSTP
jgi:hypothetical protein